jgi:hypothetical protein
MSDQAQFDYEVTRQLWEEEQSWLKDQQAQSEWLLFLELLNGQQRPDLRVH